MNYLNIHCNAGASFKTIIIKIVKQSKIKTLKTQSELNVETSKLRKARENAGEQVVVGFKLASDWLREWCKFSWPITERS